MENSFFLNYLKKFFLLVVFVQHVESYTIIQPNSYYRSCAAGYYLEITYARYYHSICSNQADVKSIINSNCNYNSACTIYAQNAWLGGNPCPGYTKYLYWTDSCNAIWSEWSAWSACPGDCTTHNLSRQRTCLKPNGACGTVPMDSISCKRVGCYSSSEISRSTPNDYTYYDLKVNCLVATGRTHLTFRVKANNDAHLAFTTTDSTTSGTAYEIAIGGWANTGSIIRFGIGGTECVRVSHNPLSQTYYDEFWVSWTENYVRVGSGSSIGSGIFLSCYNESMYSVNFIWIKTGWGASGEWRFIDDVACTHVTNTYVTITSDDTSCDGKSVYVCNAGYKQIAGNTERTCQYGSNLSGYPLVCTVSTCQLDILFIIEASVYTSSIHSALMTVVGDLAGTMQISTSNIQVGVITFDDIVDQNIEFNDFSSSASSLDSAISSITIPSASSAVNLAKALRVGFYDFFTLSKGNRFTAFKHFVLIAKTYSSQTGASVADRIRLNLRNQLFTIGISPSASLVTDLKAIAGDDSRYMEYSSPEDMSSQFNTILQKIAVCPTIILEPMTADCEIDMVFIVERYNLRYSKRFLSELMDNITVSSDGIRIGLVLFDSTASTQFRLTTHTSSEAVRGAIEAISETNRVDHLVDKGLIEARDNVFTASRGDRITASNHYVFIVGPFESYPEAVAKDIRSSGSNYVYAIHIGNQYQQEYQKAVDSCGDYTRYTNVDFYDNLITIKDDIIRKITSCQSVTVTTPDCPLDIVFIMEDTVAMNTVEFNDMKSFFISLVSRMSIGDTATKVGVVTYADGATTAFPLNQYSTGTGIISGIRNINQGSNVYSRSSRYVDKALKHIQTNFFTTGNGDRSNAPNYYILLVKGPPAESKAAFSSAVSSIASSEVFIIGVSLSSSVDSEYLEAVDDDKYLKAVNFSVLQCINDVVVLNITQCHDSITPTTLGSPESYTIRQLKSYYRSCATGYFLEITYATYYHTACSNQADVKSIINSNCNYNSACTIYAKNAWLGGNPCPGYTKYLNWKDSCNAIWSEWSAWSACPGDCTTHNLSRQRTCLKPNGACGTVPTDYTTCKRVGCYSSSEISTSTPDDFTWYNLKANCIVATGRTNLTFRAKASNDLHIAFTSTDSVTSGTGYDIVIGGWTNTRSTIRLGVGGTECVNTNHNPLSQTFYDEFWISWTGNYVRVGSGSSVGSGIFLSCYHASMYSVNFIWISTGWGSTGEWRFINDVACTHVTNTYVTITNDDTSCNGKSVYECNSEYKQIAGNTERTCGFGSILSGYPLVCAVSTCQLDILFIIEASVYTSSIHSALMTVVGDLAGTMQISTSNIQVGVITFDDIVDQNIEFNDFSSSASSLDSAISSITIPSASSAVNLAEALRVGFYDFFTLSKGNRFTAFKHFVLIAKTYSSQTGASVADRIRLNLKNQLFTIGISPSASLVTDLKAIAGNDSSYMEYSSPEDMSTQFNTILQKIAVCPTIILEPMTADCEIDMVFIVERYNLRYSKRFLAELMDNITVSSDGIRIGLVLFDSTASTQFRLTTHTSSEAVRGAIEAISETNRTDHLVDKGLIEARDNVFTASRGDRITASNHYVFIVGPYESYPEAVAKDIRSSGSNYVYAIHIGNQYQKEYQKAVDSCGDYTRYTNVDSYENLITIKDDIIRKITSCQSVNITAPDCPLDLVFIMEDTDEISIVEFNDMKSFFVSLVSRMIIGDTATKVGVVTYADGATTAFTLNQYSTGSGIISGITNINQGSNAYNRSSRYVDKALKHIQMNFFTTGNGDRSNAPNYYILLVKGPSEESKATAFSLAVRSIASSEVFIIGVNISSSVDTEYLEAVDDDKYLKAVNFSVLQCINDVVVPNITQCPDSITPTTLVSPGCQLDIVFIIERSESSSHENYVFLKGFFSNIARQLNVASDQIRVGVITYNTHAYTTFALDEYMTPTEISYQILKLPEGTDKRYMIDNALAFAKTKFFTAANGDRASAANYYVFAIDGVRSGTSIQGEFILKSWPNTIFAIDINSGYKKEYKRTTAVDSRYFFVSSYANLSSIESDVISAITSCPVPQPVTTTDGSLMFADVSAPCLNSLIYLYPEDLTEGKDGGIDTMYIMTDFVYSITSCSRITSWEFSHWKSGYIDFMVWRPTGTKYQLVAFNSLYVSGKNTTTYTVVDYERIAVLEGDVIGWRSKGDNLITSGNCLGPCAEGYKASPNNVQVGDEFDWANSGSPITGTAYAIKACLEDNEAISFSTSTISSKIPDHLPIGAFVMLLEPDGADYAEIVNYTVMPHPSYPSSTEYFSVVNSGQVTVAKKFVKAKFNSNYAFLIKATDSCNTTATATVSVQTQNMPPEILDMPNIISITEETDSNTVVYNTKVEDPTGDNVCCSLEGTIPKSNNFVSKGNGSGFRVLYSIMSSDKPVFSYRTYNSYIVKLCCDDSEDKSTGVIIVNIKKPNKTTTYEPPEWFMLSVGLSCAPIFIMAAMACFVLIHTMFILN